MLRCSRGRTGEIRMEVDMLVVTGLLLGVAVSCWALVSARERLAARWRLLAVLQDALDRHPLSYGTQVFVTPSVFRPTRVVLSARGLTQEGRDHAVWVVRQKLAGSDTAGIGSCGERSGASEGWVDPRAGVAEVYADVRDHNFCG